MDEEMKKLIAVFRFGVISDFVGDRALPRGFGSMAAMSFRFQIDKC